MKPDVRFERDLIAMAQEYGFRLRQREADTGQIIWAWGPSDYAPEPEFLTRSQAIAYMSARIDRLGG